MNDSQPVRFCLETQCEHCHESGPISSCSFQISQVEGHAKSPLAMMRGDPCHYHLPGNELGTINSDFLRVCADYYPEQLL